MLSAERASRLQAIVGEAIATTMRSGAKRKAFAKRLAWELGMEPSRVQSFVAEMAFIMPKIVKRLLILRFMVCDVVVVRGGGGQGGWVVKPETISPIEKLVGLNRA